MGLSSLGFAFAGVTRVPEYDLITGEPPPPRTPGAVNIYTREYFQLIHDHLAEGGMTTYWLPVGRPNPGTDVDTIVRAFCDVFEDCSLWNATPFDLMLVGSRHATAWQTPALQARLREVGFEQPEQIGATFVGDAAFARQEDSLERVADEKNAAPNRSSAWTRGAMSTPLKIVCHRPAADSSTRRLSCAVSSSPG